MRIPAPTDIETRDGTLTKGAKILNGFIDDGNVFKRPAASSNLVTVTAGEAQGAIYSNFMYMIVGDVMTSYNAAFTLQQTIYLNR